MGGDAGRSVIRFVAARMVRLGVTMLVCSVVVYGALYLAPGGVLSAITGGRLLSKADQAQIVAQYHLDDPLALRYMTWLGHALTGDLGRSLVSRQPVVDFIGPRIETTALLVAYGAVLIVVVGVGSGLLAATRRGAVDGIVVAATGASAAVPSFVAAAFLVAVFAVALGIFPTFGSGSGRIGDRILHLTLPAVALALASIGYVSRVTRSVVLEEQNRDHVQTAIARGFTRPRVLGAHVVRNSLVPITTTVGVTIAGLIAGSVVVERIFALDGLGSLLLTAIDQKDYAVVQAVTLILVASFVALNAVVDLLYPVLDPRIGRGSAW